MNLSQTVKLIQQQTSPVVLKDGWMTTTTPNLTISARGPFEGVDVTIPSAELAAVAAVADEDDLNYSVVGSRMTIKSGPSKWAIRLSDPDMLQMRGPERQDTAQFSLSKADIEKIVLVSKAVDKREERNEMNGVKLEHYNGGVYAVATDGISLIRRFLIRHETPFSLPVLLPISVVSLLYALPIADGEAHIAMGDKTISVAVPGLRFTHRLTEAEFVPYRDMFGARINPEAVRVDTADLLNGIKLATVLRSRADKRCPVSITGEGTTVSVTHESEGMPSVSDMGGEVIYPIDLHADAAKLHTAIRALQSPRISIRHKKALDMAILHPSEDESFDITTGDFAVIAPMRKG